MIQKPFRKYIRLPMCAVVWMLAATPHQAGTITYTYDEEHRLTQATYPKGSTIYRYDDAHNLIHHRAVRDTDGDEISDNWEIYYWGAVGQATKTSDHDGDGATDREEFIMGSDPEDHGDFLKMIQIEPLEDNGFRLSWHSEENKFYSIERASNLIERNFDTLQKRIPATPPINTYTDLSATHEGPWFYRIWTE